MGNNSSQPTTDANIASSAPQSSAAKIQQRQAEDNPPTYEEPTYEGTSSAADSAAVGTTTQLGVGEALRHSHPHLPSQEVEEDELSEYQHPRSTPPIIPSNSRERPAVQPLIVMDDTAQIASPTKKKRKRRRSEDVSSTLETTGEGGSRDRMSIIPTAFDEPVVTEELSKRPNKRRKKSREAAYNEYASEVAVTGESAPVVENAQLTHLTYDDFERSSKKDKKRRKKSKSSERTIEPAIASSEAMDADYQSNADLEDDVEMAKLDSPQNERVKDKEKRKSFIAAERHVKSDEWNELASQQLQESLELQPEDNSQEAQQSISMKPKERERTRKRKAKDTLEVNRSDISGDEIALVGDDLAAEEIEAEASKPERRREKRKTKKKNRENIQVIETQRVSDVPQLNSTEPPVEGNHEDVIVDSTVQALNYQSPPQRTKLKDLLQKRQLKRSVIPDTCSAERNATVPAIELDSQKHTPPSDNQLTFTNQKSENFSKPITDGAENLPKVNQRPTKRPMSKEFVSSDTESMYDAPETPPPESDVDSEEHVHTSDSLHGSDDAMDVDEAQKSDELASLEIQQANGKEESGESGDDEDDQDVNQAIAEQAGERVAQNSAQVLIPKPPKLFKQTLPAVASSSEEATAVTKRQIPAIHSDSESNSSDDYAMFVPKKQSRLSSSRAEPFSSKRSLPKQPQPTSQVFQEQAETPTAKSKPSRQNSAICATSTPVRHQKSAAIVVDSDDEGNIKNSGRRLPSQHSDGPKEWRTGPFDPDEQEAIYTFRDQWCDDNSKNEFQFSSQCHDNARNNPSLRRFWSDMQEWVPRRPRVALQKFCRRKFHNYEFRGTWTPQEDQQIRRLVAEHGSSWVKIGKEMERLPEDVRDRYRNYVATGPNMEKKRWPNFDVLALRTAVGDCMLRTLRNDVVDDEEFFKGSYVRDILDTIRDAASLLSWEAVSKELKGKRSRLQCSYKWRALVDAGKTTLSKEVEAAWDRLSQRRINGEDDEQGYYKHRRDNSNASDQDDEVQSKKSPTKDSKKSKSQQREDRKKDADDLTSDDSEEQALKPKTKSSRGRGNIIAKQQEADAEEDSQDEPVVEMQQASDAVETTDPVDVNSSRESEEEAESVEHDSDDESDEITDSDESQTPFNAEQASQRVKRSSQVEASSSKESSDETDLSGQDTESGVETEQELEEAKRSIRAEKSTNKEVDEEAVSSGEDTEKESDQMTDSDEEPAPSIERESSQSLEVRSRSQSTKSDEASSSDSSAPESSPTASDSNASSPMLASKSSSPESSPESSLEPSEDDAERAQQFLAAMMYVGTQKHADASSSSTTTSPSVSPEPFENHEALERQPIPSIGGNTKHNETSSSGASTSEEESSEDEDDSPLEHVVVQDAETSSSGTSTSAEEPSEDEAAPLYAPEATRESVEDLWWEGIKSQIRSSQRSSQRRSVGKS
ncbi:MAG: hypothetical protein MMC23_001573 [Stictis urceolatum]|nr:hypothetical protein [Stictis urceolata]